MKNNIQFYLKTLKTSHRFVSGPGLRAKVLSWILILTILPIIGFSQNTEFFVSGQVINSETFMPINNHLVYILSDTTGDIPDTYYKEIFTNSEGIFHVSVPYPINDRIFYIYTYDCENMLYDTAIIISSSGISSNNDINVDFKIFEENTSSCNSDFYYYQDTLSHQDNFYYFFDNSGEDVESWIWDFGDGHTSSMKDPVHQYEKFGLYTVSMIALSYDIYSNMCIDTIRKQLNVGGLNYYNFGGHPFVDPPFPIDLGTVYLYSIDVDVISPIDTATFVDSIGYYYFYQVPEGQYVVKVNLDQESVYYNDYSSTYYGNTIDWEDAEVIELNGNYWDYDVNMVPFTQFESGEGKINGNVEFLFEKFNTVLPASNVELLLKDENDNYLMCSHTDDFGEFFFIGIPLGTYEIIAEYTGFEIDPLLVDLTDAQPIIDNINITINIADTTSFSIDENFSAYIENVGLVYPNPATNSANCKISVKKSSNFDILLFNNFGQIVYRENKSLMSGDHIIKLNIDNLASGYYNLHIATTDNVRFTQKLIKL
ncbi:MAG: T9SS type A sorting domain-containing protein [Bacteroidales bacterium]|nr:T9SS type A sorting domain-containing protein [Bacteroidales bacterium]